MEDTNGINFDRPEAPNQRNNATNYFRLMQLTMLEGTNVVRKTILSRLRHCKTLHTVLEERRSEFFQRGSGFNRQQLGVLYPASGNADLAKIDMTLWFTLGRKLRVIPQTNLEDLRIEESGSSSNAAPLLGTQVEWCQDLTTIHSVRNNLFHLVKPEMDMEMFDDHWKRLTEAVMRLDPGLDPSVLERYSTAEFNPKAVIELRAMIMEQCLQERCEALVGEVGRRNRIIQLILIVVALVVLLILAGALLFVFLFRQPRTCDKSVVYKVIGNVGCLYFLPRSGWEAESPTEDIERLRLPVPNVVYTHTAEISACVVTEECCNQVKNIQYLHMHVRERPLSDIGIHFLIDSKGIVYEGRSITRIPAAAPSGWNRNITSVAFIGNFMYQTPTAEALAAFDLLIAYLRFNNYIMRNYTIYGTCELRNTLSPGRNLYKEINRSILNHIFGHVRHRPDNHCFFNDTMAESRGRKEHEL